MKAINYNLNTTIIRLRALREIYYFNIKILIEKNTKLKTKIKALSLKEISNYEFLDFDVKNIEQSIKLKHFTITKKTSNISDTEKDISENNKKYLNVFYFYNKK